MLGQSALDVDGFRQNDNSGSFNVITIPNQSLYKH